MSATERTRKRRERLRQEQGLPPKPGNPELTAARAEIARLREQLAAAAKPKQAKVPLDPESETARQIAALRKKNKALREDAERWQRQLRSLVPTAVKAKVAKALHEQSTSAEIRLDALQAWNGLGLNNVGK